MTFIRTRAGLLHLAVLLDLYSRPVVGWTMGERPNLPLAMNALDMALLQRLPQQGLVHDTDKGRSTAHRLTGSGLPRTD